MFESISDEIRSLLAEIPNGSAVEISTSFSTVDPIAAMDAAVAPKRPGRNYVAKVRSDAGTLQELSSDKFMWLHLSDLHFGAGSASWRRDHEQVVDALVSDLTRARFTADRIFVTGDVAFSGTPDQYETALEALQRISDAVYAPMSSIRLVPGNHDVNRITAGQITSVAMHQYARTVTSGLDEFLEDENARGILSSKLAGYSAFVQRIEGHPSELDWCETISINESLVNIWGLCSVWVSDALDGIGGQQFVPNLLLARSQYRSLFQNQSCSVVNIVLTHHPLEWLNQIHAQWFRSAFSPRMSVHLCGHVHRAHGSAMRRLGQRDGLLTLVAGASHADPAEQLGRHSYSRCVLKLPRHNRFALGWSPRVYDADRGQFTIDRNSFDLDDEGYAWHVFDNHDS